MPEVAKQALLAACALLGALVSGLRLGVVYWGAAFVGFSVASSDAVRMPIFFAVGVGGAACVTLMARLAFRSIEFLIGRRPADSIAMIALVSAATGLALGTLVRNTVYGSEAQVYAPIYILGGAASIAGVWLGARLNARLASSAV